MTGFWKYTLAGVAATLIITMLLATGCDREGGNKKAGAKYLPEAQGGPYELVVVAGHAEWGGAVGDTLRSMFHRKFPNVVRDETMFTTLRVLPEGFKRFTTRHHNIMIVSITGDETTAPSLALHKDVYARPQIIVTATAPDESSMAGLLSANRDDILLLFESAEREHDVADAMGHAPKAIRELIREKFGFEMSMGPAYKVQKMENESDDFLWLAYKMTTSDQGIIIYSYPFSGPQDFEMESLIRRRDEFVSRIPGENPGSHMATNPEFTELLYKVINGRQWSELHGMWDVTGDFMGGPYTNYSTLDAVNQRVIAIDFYVFAPDIRQSQRNYKKQLEHYLYTVKIP